jgi:4-phytase/acid phosphatase
VRALLAVTLAALALAPAAAPAASGDVRLEVVLMRHGVRSPTKPASAYADYANAPWPEWPVAPGMLTAHGRDGMRGIGARLRAQLTADGIMDGACPDPSTFAVIGDSTPRNRESSAALLQGLVPGCGTGFLATAGTSSNPLFHYGASDDDTPPLEARPAPPGDPRQPAEEAPPALATLQSILLDCPAATCPATASRDGRKLLPEEKDKAMKLAGTLSENLMLAYAEGMPMDKVAFGRADARLLGQLIALHNAQFAATKKAMPAAAQAGSNLVAHIAATLGAGPARAEPLLASRKGIVVLVGHDTNLANVAGVLGLDWHDPERPDDYPPGGALLFSLVHAGTRDIVRVRSLMPAMDALRENRFTGMKAAPVHVKGCRLVDECTLEEFRRIVERNLDPSRVDDRLPAMTSTPLKAQRSERRTTQRAGGEPRPATGACVGSRTSPPTASASAGTGPAACPGGPG